MNLKPGTTIAVIGGAGSLGFGLSARWAGAGFVVAIGCRDPARGNEAAEKIRGLHRGAQVSAHAYADAAEMAAVVVLAVPFAAQAEAIGAIRSQCKGKVFIDCTVPLRPPKVGLVQLPSEGSAAQISQALLGNETKVASAFQNVSAQLLQRSGPIDCDVLICADTEDARLIAVDLVSAAGLRGIEAGPLANAAAAEALTSVLIQINRRYKSAHAGIRITGLALGESG